MVASMRCIYDVDRVHASDTPFRCTYPIDRKQESDPRDRYSIGRRPSAEPDPFFAEEIFDNSPSREVVDGDEIDEDQLLASICRDSFYEFVKEFWGEIIAEPPVWNWHVKYICDEMQKVAERVMRRERKLGDVIINIPPGTTKSTICSVMFEAWVWTRMPHARFMCIAHTVNLAFELARLSRDVVTSPKYKRLYPGITLRDDQNTKGMYLNSKKGFRFSVGSLGSVIGRHFHFLIIDDPIDPQAALSETEMLTINRWISETVEIRKVDKLVTVSILVMQRLHESDPTADKKTREPDTIQYVLPADISDPEVADLVSPQSLKQMYADGLLDPIRLSREHLAPYRAKGSYYFSGQFDQNPSPVGGGLFKVENIGVRDVPPSKWKKLIRYWDKAATHAGGAYTVGVLMGKDEYDNYWILDIQRGQWDSSTREQKIKDTAVMDGKKVIVGLEQEGGSGGKESAERTVKMLAGYCVHIVIPRGDKVLRADPFSSQVNGGNVRMKKAPWNRPYLDEMKHFPLSRYKDQIDASAGAFTLHIKPIYSVGAFGGVRKPGLQKSNLLSTPVWGLQHQRHTGMEYITPNGVVTAQ